MVLLPLIRIRDESFEKGIIRDGPLEIGVARHSPEFWGFYPSSDSDSDESDGPTPNWQWTIELDEWSLDPGFY